MSNRGLAAGTRLIPQLRNYECTFMVWPEGGFAPAHPGHAVLMLRRNRFEGPWAYEEVDGDGTYEPPYDESDTRYISFWPGSRRDKSWSRGLLGRTSGNLLPHHLEDYHREMGDGARARLSQVGEPNVPTSPRPGQIVIGRQARRERHPGRRLGATARRVRPVVRPLPRSPERTRAEHERDRQLGAGVRPRRGVAPTPWSMRVATARRSPSGRWSRGAGTPSPAVGREPVQGAPCTSPRPNPETTPSPSPPGWRTSTGGWPASPAFP